MFSFQPKKKKTTTISDFAKNPKSEMRIGRLFLTNSEILEILGV